MPSHCSRRFYGKSRLCQEFADRCRASGIEVYETQAQAHGTSIPFLPVLQMMRGYFGIEDHDSDRVAREKIAGRLLLLDPEGHIIFANEAAMALLELEEDPDFGSVSTPGWELRMPEDAECGLATLAAHSPLHDAAVVVEWPGNRRRRLCVNTLPLLRADGSVCGVLAAFADTAPWLGATAQQPSGA
jgi:PAS domain-containing protein